MNFLPDEIGERVKAIIYIRFGSKGCSSLTRGRRGIVTKAGGYKLTAKQRKSSTMYEEGR